MDCPRCHQLANIEETGNRHFLGRNSADIPFFKCRKCGYIFYVNEELATTHLVSSGHRGYRFVPITFGIAAFLIAWTMLHFFGANIPTWIVGGALVWFGFSCIKIGFWGSQKLIDEMTAEDNAPLSEDAAEEWMRIHKED